MSADKADVMAKRDAIDGSPRYGTRTIQTRVVNIPHI
ncbi:MAG: hypothetical protein QOE41_52 [Mycobacterium sp.]|jgi:hypothetical protein|nr:hypothetical protein [Mycobacterium sp.]MDT5130741.1 hypothetical protein [Mycobacterium sp.]MDT7766468.1 hypothetical protein [Mycobacterium sp.]